jgi:Lon-like protease
VNNLPPPVYVPVDNTAMLGPGAGQQVGKGRRRTPWWLIPLAILGTLGALIGLSWAIKVDYYGLGPGSAVETEPLVQTTEKTYDSKGGVFYTTVGIRRLSLFEWGMFGLGLKSDTDILPTKVYTGGKSDSQVREEGLKSMGASKETALFVALERLGKDVVITNGGALVVAVDDKLPAAQTLKTSDVIVSIDGDPVEQGFDIRPAIADRKPGDVVDAVIVRNKAEMRIKVTLADRGDGTAFIGIETDLPEGATFKFPIDISIDSGGVGGPSAGLAFTLGVLDALTPGDLTGGKKVAVTGTIDARGVVGPIGGIRQKAIAARDAGAVVFLVPADEVADLEGVTPKGLEIRGVVTIDDALAELGKLGGNVNELPAQN